MHKNILFYFFKVFKIYLRKRERIWGDMGRGRERLPAELEHQDHDVSKK